MKDTAVIILNWNGAELLRRFLPDVIKTTNTDIAEIVVVDNGSTDSSVKVLETEFPEVSVLRFDNNYGYAGGYNRAIKELATNYRFAVLLNSDVGPSDGWIEPLHDYMMSDPKAGACQPKIKSVHRPDCFEYAGAAGGFLDCNGYPYCRGRIFDTVETDSGQYDDTRSVFWATGAALMVDTKLYLSLGGLDESFFAHMEEIDLCWRIHLSGNDVAVVPESVVYHLGGASLDASNPRKTYLNFRNSLLMLEKNLPEGREKQMLLIRRRLLDTVALGRMAVGGKIKHAMAVVKAHMDFRKMRRSTTRPTPAPTHNLLTDSPEGCRNILVQYYLRRHRKFSDLD